MRSEFMGEIITDMFGAIEGGRILESIAKSDPVCPHASEAIGRFWEAADDVDLFLSLVKSSSDLRWGMTWGLFARALDWDAPSIPMRSSILTRSVMTSAAASHSSPATPPPPSSRATVTATLCVGSS